MSNIATSINGVQWNNLNWGYQIVHEGRVLLAIHDTVGGPHRTPECTADAKRKYETLCGIYERLYRWGKPTNQQLNLLEFIIKGAVTTEYARYGRVNAQSAKALMRRGIIKKINRDLWLGTRYRDFAIVDGNGNAIKLYE